jgi:His Kinase A (phospho-acceptor) domain
VSHELRTPLSSILGASTVLSLAPEVTGNARLKKLAALIHQESERLNAEIENILDASRISGHGLQTKFELAEPADFINAALQRCRNRLTGRGCPCRGRRLTVQPTREQPGTKLALRPESKRSHMSSPLLAGAATSFRRMSPHIYLCPQLPVWRLSFHGECRRVTGRRAEEKKTTRMPPSRRLASHHVPIGKRRRRLTSCVASSR